MNISQHTHQQTDRRPQPAAARRVVAAQGIGRAYAERLGAEGAHVVIADVAPADGVRTQIEAAGGSASAIECDVCDPASVTDLASAVADLGGADILLHNAGIYPMGPHDRITFEEWRRVFAVNLDSMFLLSQVFLPHMREQQWGRIVGISSAMFHAGSPGSLHYVASKGGIIGFIRALAAEVGPDGVTVNAIAPGLIDTDMTADLNGELLQAVPARRAGSPEEVAACARFLASDAAGYVTGTTLYVDGGLGA
jgi:NAD(P)-dependent dehydrogenase (short-subunit alcohol dehydrogenase family)